MDDEDSDDLSTQRDVENILDSFDISGDDRISEEEFIRGMTAVICDLSDQAPERIKRTGSKKSKVKLIHEFIKLVLKSFQTSFKIV